jgi:hypothetical protein
VRFRVFASERRARILGSREPPGALATPAKSGIPDPVKGIVGKRCIDTSIGGTTVVSRGLYQIRALGAASGLAGSIADDIENHDITYVYYRGLGTFPRPPNGFPIYLRPANISPGHSPGEGLTTHTCAAPSMDAMIVWTPLIQPYDTYAHELFHAFSNLPESWWEEASAQWAPTKVGFADDPQYDPAFLQNPGVALDDPLADDLNTPAGEKTLVHAYGAWRFVSWLDRQGMIGKDAWTTLHNTLQSGATGSAIDRELDSAFKTSLGEQLALFWADHLKEHPTTGPHTNGHPKKITADKTVTFTAGRLGAYPIDFTLGSSVKRVTFEFDHTPAQTYLYGITAGQAPEELGGRTVSFCLKGAGGGDLAWPGTFPVTLVNGNVVPSSGKQSVAVHITVETDPKTCDSHVPETCKLLQPWQIADVYGVDADDVRCDRDISSRYTSKWNVGCVGDTSEPSPSCDRIRKISPDPTLYIHPNLNLKSSVRAKFLQLAKKRGIPGLGAPNLGIKHTPGLTGYRDLKLEFLVGRTGVEIDEFDGGPHGIPSKDAIVTELARLAISAVKNL